MATFATTKEKLVNAWGGVNAPTAPVGGTMPVSGTPGGSPASPSWLDDALKFAQVNPDGVYQKDGMYYQPIYGNQQGSGENYDRGGITEWNVYGTDKTNPGDSYQKFDLSGQNTGTGQFQSVSNLPSWEDIRPLASIALAAYGGSLLSGSGVGAGAGAGSGLAGETLGKAVLDGTNIFGANSAAGALDIGALSAAAPGAAAANALGNITQGLGYTPPAGAIPGGATQPGATPPGTPTPPAVPTPGGTNPLPAVTPTNTPLTLDSIGKWISDNKNTLGLGAAAIGALGAGSGGGTAPTPKTPEQVAADQLAINKGIIDQTAPLLHPNSVNPTGSSNWTKGPDGQWTNTQTLNQGSQGLFDSSTQGLQSLLGGINPNEKAPELIKDAGGKYSQQLADAIYARMERQFKPAQDTARSKLETRLAERGFAPGTDGWDKEMNRFDQQIGGQIQDATNQAQITAASQGLNEANFTNNALLGEFNATGNNRATLAQLLSGARNGSIAGLNTLPTSGSSPALPTTSAAGVNATNYGAELDKYNNTTQTQNDLWATLMKYGLNLFGK